MSDERGLARTIWKIGVLVRGDTAGGRSALARATAIHPTLEGIGESRLIRAAVTGAQEAGPAQNDDAVFRPPGLEGVEWPDRLVWIADVDPVDVAMAFQEEDSIRRPIEISAAPPPGRDDVRDALDRLWISHGQDACRAALAVATRRSKWATLGVFVALALFLAAMTFVVHDLMQGAQRERDYQEQADLYSVPEEAIEAPTEP